MAKKKSSVSIFFLMFLKAMVVILGIVIVVLLAIYIKGAISAKKINEHALENGTVDDSVLTETGDVDYMIDDEGEAEATTAVANPDVSAKDLRIEVLNATGKSGLAGKWKDRLIQNGFNYVDAHNYGDKLDNTKIVVANEAYAQELLQIFPNATVEVGTVTKDLTDAPIENVSIFVIIGTSDIIK